VNPYSLKFIEWRAEKHILKNNVSVDVPLPQEETYDFILLLDAIEHMDPDKCEEEIGRLVKALKLSGSIITNYFQNVDYHNPEHINMNKSKIRKLFMRLGLQPLTISMWQKWREQ